MSPLRSNFQAISLGNTWELVSKRRILRINHFYREISLELWFMVANMEVADGVAEMEVDMEVDMVADMEVDMMTDMVATKDFWANLFETNQ